MKNAPFLSVVLDAVGKDTGIEPAVQSLLRQTAKDWELLVIIEAVRTDKINTVLESANHDPRVRVLRTSVPWTPSQYMNDAVREAQGQWISFLDAGDSFDPEYLTKVRSRAEAHHGISFISCWFTLAGGSGGKMRVCLPSPSFIRMRMHKENYLPYSGTCFPKVLWLKAGGFFSSDASIPQAQALWLRFFRLGAPLGIIEEPLVSCSRIEPSIEVTGAVRR